MGHVRHPGHGTFLDIEPTGNRIRVEATFSRFGDGGLVVRDVFWDVPGLLAQLGA